MDEVSKIRQQYPQYDDLSDGDLLLGLHRKFYSDMHVKDFLSKVDPEDRARYSISDDMWPYWKDQVSRPLNGENEAERDRRLYGEDMRAKPTGYLEGLARSVTHGGFAGGGDEVIGTLAAAAHPLVHDDETTFKQRRNYYVEREREKNAAFRESNPGSAFVGEAGGFLATSAAALPKALLTANGLRSAVATGVGSGAVYGALDADGEIGDRISGAATGGVVGAVGGAAVHGLGRGVNRLLQNRSIQSQAAQAPGSSEILDQASRGFEAVKQHSIPAPVRQTLLENLAGMGKRKLINKTLHKKSTGVLKSAAQLPADDLRLGDLHNLRQLTALAKKGPDRHLSGQFRNEIDKSIASTGTPAARVFDKSLKTHARGERVKALENMAFKADNAAGGFRQGLNSQLRSVLNNPAKASRFDKATQQTIKDGLDHFSSGTLTNQIAPWWLPTGMVESAERFAMGKGNSAARKLMQKVQAEQALGRTISSKAPTLQTLYLESLIGAQGGRDYQ